MHYLCFQNVLNVQVHYITLAIIVNPQLLMAVIHSLTTSSLTFFLYLITSTTQHITQNQIIYHIYFKMEYSEKKSADSPYPPTI